MLASVVKVELGLFLIKEALSSCIDVIYVAWLECGTGFKCSSPTCTYFFLIFQDKAAHCAVTAAKVRI